MAYFYFVVEVEINIKLFIGKVMALSCFTRVLKMVWSNGPEPKKKFERLPNKNWDGFWKGWKLINQKQ